MLVLPSRGVLGACVMSWSHSGPPQRGRWRVLVRKNESVNQSASGLEQLERRSLLSAAALTAAAHLRESALATAASPAVSTAARHGRGHRHHAAAAGTAMRSMLELSPTFVLGGRGPQG